jgi:hypothetical protein
MATDAPLYRCALCGHCCYQHDMLSSDWEDATDFGCPGCGAWHPGLEAGQGWIALPPEAFAEARRVLKRRCWLDSFRASAYTIAPPDRPPY